MTIAPFDNAADMTQRPRDMDREETPSPTTDVFGSLTFTGDVMLKRLSEGVFRKLQRTMVGIVNTPTRSHRERF